MSNESKQRKQEYDQAQKVGERTERMCREDGWKLHLIPKFQKLRDEAQIAVNKKGVDDREADYQRGVICICDMILSYEEDSRKRSEKIMRSNSNSKLPS